MPWRSPSTTMPRRSANSALTRLFSRVVTSDWSEPLVVGVMKAWVMRPNLVHEAMFALTSYIML